MTSCQKSLFTSTIGDGLRTAFLIACCLFLLGLPVSSSSAQDSVPEFSIDIVGARSDASSALTRVDVYTRIGYSHLIFETTTNGFTAEYELSLEAFELNEDNQFRNPVQSKIWDGNIVVDTYAQTRSDDRWDLTTQSLDLAPGRYVFEFELVDANSSNRFVQEVPVEVRGFNRPAAVSDLTLIESYDRETFSIVPRIGRSVATSDGGFQLFYEIYTNRAERFTVRREVFRTVRDGGVPVAPPSMEEAEEEEDAIGAVFSEDERLDMAAGKSQHVVVVPLIDIKAGAYIVRVSLVDSNGAVLDAAEKAITVQWSGLAAHIENFDDAIQQLEYIAKKRDIDFIREGASQLERVRRFEQFWEKRDPTPNTKRNESMEEYYYRVDSANRNYGAVQDGWKTDRGYVFVKYGEPDYVERQPFSFDYEPYEVWIYERIGRRFIFVDKTGFGDYELLRPVWDERTRLY